jgi:hypothetical protein
MHINGLNCDQRAKSPGVLKDQIGDEPGIDDGVVGVNQNGSAAGLFAPSGDVNDLLDVTIAREILGLRAGGEDFDLRSIEDAHDGIGPPDCQKRKRRSLSSSPRCCVLRFSVRIFYTASHICGGVAVPSLTFITELYLVINSRLFRRGFAALCGSAFQRAVASLSISHSR